MAPPPIAAAPMVRAAPRVPWRDCAAKPVPERLRRLAPTRLVPAPRVLNRVPPTERLVRAADREKDRVPARKVEREKECVTRPPLKDGCAKDRLTALRE